MVFLYKKKSKFRSMFSVCMVLVTAVCAMATIVIAQETPAAESPQVADVQDNAEATAVAEPTADNSSGISNQYIAAATSVSTVAVAAVPVVEANASAPPTISSSSSVMFVCRARLYCCVSDLTISPAASVADFMATMRAVCSLTAASMKHWYNRTLTVSGSSSASSSFAGGEKS